MEVQPGQILIARVWSWRADRLRADADRDHREQVALERPDPDYSVSTFGIKVDDRDAETLMRELCALIERSAKWVTFTTDARLAEAGFAVRLSEPPEGHYDVVIGQTLTDEAVTRLEAVFSEEPRRRFPECSN